MNKEMIQSENFVTVLTDEGLIKRKQSNKIMNILQTENNIEEIENSLKNINGTITFKKLYDEFFYGKNLFKMIIVSIPIIALILVSIGSFSLALAFAAASGTVAIEVLITHIISFVQANNLSYLIDAQQRQILSDELEKQKKELQKLEKESEKNKVYNTGIIEQTQKIERTKLISDLKRKLVLIKEYQLMKKHLIAYSKNHFTSIKLRDMGYSESDIEFIQSLLFEDIKFENQNKQEYNQVETRLSK